MSMELIQEFVGKTKTQKVVDDCYKIYKENFEKQYPDYLEKNHTKLSSLVTALEDNEIKHIGMSVIDDLLSDNWGIFLTRFLAMNPASDQVYRDSLNGLHNLFLWTGSTTQSFNNISNGSIGSRVKVGKGTTPATRTDYEIETALQTLISGNGGWNSGLGKISIPASNSSTFTDSISETALFGVWWTHNPVGAVREFLLSHDNISPVVPVLTGQTINVDYSMILS